mmetsp:Transcript_36101/g.103950  ORF Transcript_36101/g.103950 Transcript_36101/m.103950 type:complete len:255 (+) Transcript_36101:12-776(+)
MRHGGASMRACIRRQSHGLSHLERSILLAVGNRHRVPVAQGVEVVVRDRQRLGGLRNDPGALGVPVGERQDRGLAGTLPTLAHEAPLEPRLGELQLLVLRKRTGVRDQPMVIRLIDFPLLVEVQAPEGEHDADEGADDREHRKAEEAVARGGRHDVSGVHAEHTVNPVDALPHLDRGGVVDTGDGLLHAPGFVDGLKKSVVVHRGARVALQCAEEVDQLRRGALSRRCPCVFFHRDEDGVDQRRALRERGNLDA